MIDTKGLRTWIEINKDNLKHNVAVFKNIVGKKQLMAVVKSNAYGHSLVDFSQEAERLGVDWLAVDSIVEGLKLRKERITLPILVLGYTLPEKVQEAVAADISLTVSNYESLKEWGELALEKKIRIHVKVDTGLHRQGFLEDELPEIIKFLKFNSDRFDVEGLFTHFAKAKNPDDRSYTSHQIVLFKKWIAAFNDAGFMPLTHASATGGAMLYHEAHFDMARVGAGLYGVWPSQQVRQAFEKTLTLKPVLSWKTIVVEIKKIKKDEGVGYDLSEVVTRDTTIAICPIGYWHGLPRHLSSIGEVLVGGKRAKILGRVAMDMIMIDITTIPEVERYAEVVLIGAQNTEEITADEVADKCGTTAYEILTRLNPLIKRIYY